MFTELIESYRSSSAFEALAEKSRTDYKVYLNRLLELGSDLKLDFDMPKQVAVARSRSHIEYWERKVRSSKFTNYEKGRLLVILKLVYRSHGLGNLVEGVKLPTNMKHERGEAHPLVKNQVEQLRVGQLNVYRVFLYFLFYTGMRPSEAMNLKWADVEDKFINIVGSKDREAGKVSRKVPILPEVRWCLMYCKTLGPSQWVFVTEHRRPLNKDMVCQKRKEIFQELGINGVTYDARRGLATEMIRKGYSLLDVAGLLGHKSIKTTERYVRFTMEEKASAFKGV